MQGRGKVIASMVFSIIVIAVASYWVWQDNRVVENEDGKDSVKEQVQLDDETIQKYNQKKLEAEYESLYNMILKEESNTGIYYVRESIEDNIYDDVVKKYNGDELIWSITFTETNIDNVKEFEDGIIVYGRKDYKDAETVKWILWLAKVDMDGNVVWEKSFDKEPEECIDEIIIEDGIIHAITRTDTASTNLPTWNSLLQLDMDGNVVNRVVTNVGMGVTGVIKHKDSFYISLSSLNKEDQIMKLNEDGTYEIVIICESENYEYEIKSMIEYNDKLYISVNEVATSATDIAKQYSEVAAVRDGLYFEEEELDVIRSYKTAALLVWDANEGSYEVVYAEDKKMATDLKINENNQLIWGVERMEVAKSADIGTSFSHNVYSVNSVYDYFFDEKMELIDIEKQQYYAQYSQE